MVITIKDVAIQFPKNLFYGLRASQRPSSVGVKVKNGINYFSEILIYYIVDYEGGFRG